MCQYTVHLKNNSVPGDKDKEEEKNELDESNLNFIFD